MKKVILLSLLIALTLLTTSCLEQEIIETVFTYTDGDIVITYNNDFTDVSKISGVIQEIELEGLKDYLLIDRALPNLQFVNLYWDGDDVIFDIHLDKEVLRNEVINCKDFFGSFALETKRENYGFGGAINYFFDINNVKIDNRVLNLYIDDTQLIRWRVKLEDSKVIDSSYFENTIFGDKYLKPFDMDLSNLSKDLHTYYPTSRVEVLKTLDYQTLLIKIEMDKKISNKDISNIQSLVWDDFVKNNEKYLMDNFFKNINLSISKNNQVVYMGRKGIYDSHKEWDE